jgi:transcription antitermination factor NusG
MEKMMDEESLAQAVLAPPAHPDFRWYVVHAYSGMEKAVERNIAERIARAGMQDKFGRIMVPTEEVVEMKNGQRRTTERRFFPGYVLVEMIMDDESWHLVKHTNKVTGFVGGAKNRPAPISQAEVEKIVSQMQEGATRLSSWWASWCASRKAPSPTSMARWKKSITRKTKFACRSRFLVEPPPSSWNSVKSKRPDGLASGAFRLGARWFEVSR